MTEEHPNMESAVVRGISVEKEQAKVTIENVSDQPGVASRIFQAISESGVIIDMIVQNVSKLITRIFHLLFTDQISKGPSKQLNPYLKNSVIQPPWKQRTESAN